jgi:MFS family permease
VSVADLDDPAEVADTGHDDRLFRSLEYPGAKRYFTGLSLSMVGTWMQSVALSWLIVKQLDGGGRELGWLLIATTGPILLLGAWAGSLADRVDKRRLMFVTQLAMAAAAIGLAALDFSGHATLPLVLTFASISGLASAFDTPVRRSIIGDLVPRDALPNAMSLNTGVITSARVLGMAVGGYVIRFGGTEWCFLLNGLSYVAMIVALHGLAERRHADAVGSAEGGVLSAVGHVWRTPVLRVAMIATLLTATFTFNYSLTFPLLVKDVFGREADGLGSLYAITSIGSFTGALASAKRREPMLSIFLLGALVMGVFATGVAVAPSYLLAAVSAVPMGFGGGLLMAQFTGLLTSLSPSTMRGRVLALQTVVFLGSTPIGGPIVGAVSDAFGPRWAMGTGAIAACGAVVLGVALSAVMRIPLRGKSRR